MSNIARNIATIGFSVAFLTPLAWAGPEERPGDQFEFKVEDLAEPSKGVANPGEVIERGDLLPTVPEGFEISVFAEGLDQPRLMAFAPNGDLFVTEPDSRFRPVENPNKVRILRDTDADGEADMVAVFAEDFDRPMGLVFVDGALLVADVKGVWRLPYSDGAIIAESRERITEENALGKEVGSHYQRVIALDPDGEHMYVTVGSTANVKDDPKPHASVQRFKLDGSEQMTFASGIRVPISMAFYPGTDDLYVVANERDMLGDDLVPDYFTRIQEGDFFGWPWAYMGGTLDTRIEGGDPDLIARTKTPDVLFDSHSAPVGLVIYDSEQFPEEYRGDAFVTLHGSWNKGNATGYKVVRVPFEDGRPVGGYENFVTGIWIRDTERPKIIARPAGLIVAPDGSLFLSDDGNDLIYRIRYLGN